MNWRIYYADGSTFDNQDGAPSDAPGLGIIVIVQKHDDAREGAYLQHRADYYIWADLRWWACDLFRFWQYIFSQKYDHEKVALAGETIHNSTYVEIVRTAKNDKDFYDPTVV